LNKEQSVKDAIFSGEWIVTSNEDPSILTDLGFASIVSIGRARKNNLINAPRVLKALIGRKRNLLAV